MALRNRPDLKLILMSATMMTDKFSSYLGTKLHMTGGHAPVLFIPGRTYPVSEYFKGDYLKYVRDVGESSGKVLLQSDQTISSEEETTEWEGGGFTTKGSTYDCKEAWKLVCNNDRFIGGKRREGDLVDYDLIVRLVLRLLWAPVSLDGRFSRLKKMSTLIEYCNK